MPALHAVSLERHRARTADSPATQVPPDWPDSGPIDLSTQDLPHASATLEWWYVNTHFKTKSGRDLSLFAVFFRQARGKHPETGELEHGHTISWALTDPAQARYYPKVAVDASAPEFGLAKLDAGLGFDDERIQRALREVLVRGHVPGPTRMFTSEPSVAKRELRLEYDGDSFHKQPDGSYVLALGDTASGVGAKLTFSPRKAPIRYGNDGVVHGVADEQMFYYFIPRCDVSGVVTLDGTTEEIEGTGWYDHEFGFIPKQQAAQPPVEKRRGAETAWRWLSLQLEDGTDVSVFMITRRATGEILDNWTIVSDRSGKRREFRDARLETLETWRSTRSFIEYPTRLRLESRAARLSLEIDAAFPDQEVLTVISDPGFWEGRVNVHGSLDGERARGVGFLECKGFRFPTLGAFFNSVGAEVRRRVGAMLSAKSHGALESWVVRGYSSEVDRARYVAGIDSSELERSLVAPIREIVDRGGKAWRSYAALACIDVVGGDSRQFLHWLALPEILHVGSLIVDDVEDESTVRRGEAACHVLHGVPVAINAGTAAYFLAEPPVMDESIPVEAKLKIYRLYFDTLRAGHAGQALDLVSPDALAHLAVQTGITVELEARVLGLHRLKTAAPAGMLARTGAILGGGSDAQVEALGQFFEAVGLAFQIVDDVLNLRGFEGDLKQRGEDIRQGKVTLPIVKALQLLPRSRREMLWETLRSKPTDESVVNRMINELEDVGALSACSVMARGLVEEAWHRLDPLLEDSQFKVTFRAFGWYVLDRHY